MEFDGKIAIVTGATSGIGMATSLKLAAEGAQVAAVGRRREALAKLEGKNIRPYVADLTKEIDTESLVAGVLKDFGGIDILVNAAGIIITFAGAGPENFAGDNGPAASALLSRPFGVAIDSAGSLYIA